MAAYSRNEGRRAALIRQMLEEKGTVPDELYAPNAVSYRPWDLVAKALSGVKSPRSHAGAVKTEVDVGARRMYSDDKITVDDVIESGDQVRIQWTLNATHKNEFFGIEPTGEQVSATGFTTYRFAEGKIVEIWGAVNCASLGAICAQTVEALARTGTMRAVCHVNPTEHILREG